MWWGLVALAAGAAGAGAWAGGVDFVVLKRVKLILTALVAVLVLMRHWRAGPLARRRVYLTALAVAAGLSWVVHFNFFAFHGTAGRRVYMHLHEIAHYYLGSKYAPELGYGELYTAMLRAEAERYHDHFTTLEARDLHTNRLVDIRALLRRSGAVKDRFTPERWNAFTEDVAFFRDALGPQYGGILRDHGYNPSPLWTLIGGSLANLVPAGSGTGILLLTLLDPVLEAGVFLAILWAFGAEVTLLSMLYFCLLFGASFGWLGGAFLRHMWLFGVVVAVCCMRRNRYLLAGALLAGATLLRIFPALLLAGVGAVAAADWWAGRGLRTHHLQMFASFAAVALLLLGATALGRGRAGDWLAFRDNLQLHMQNTAFNTIGLTQILAYPGLPASRRRGRRRRGRAAPHHLCRPALYGLPAGAAVVRPPQPARDRRRRHRHGDRAPVRRARPGLLLLPGPDAADSRAPRSARPHRASTSSSKWPPTRCCCSRTATRRSSSTATFWFSSC